MNALIPAFVAVLLAEIGGPLAGFGRGRWAFASVAMVGLVIVAAIGGWTVAEFLITPARTLLLGLALLFAGFGQFGERKVLAEPPTIFASIVIVYRSPAPFLVFAFAAWRGAPLTAGAGALAGLAMAVAVGSLDLAVPRAVRIGAGAVLCLSGTIAALNGLRLV